MKGIILAAGRGSRMGDLTEDKPKCLTKLGEKSLLNWQIDSLKSAGIKDIGIVTGYMREKIQNTDAALIHNDIWMNTNMVYSLYCSREWIKNDEFIISYSDIIYDSKIISKLAEAKHDIVITYSTKWLDLWDARFTNPLDDAETFKIDKSNRLIEIGNKTNTLDDIEGQYMGLIKVTYDGWNIIKEYLERIPKQEFYKMDMTTLLRNLINEGVEIFSVPCDEIWLEVDSNEDLELYNKWIKEGRLVLDF